METAERENTFQFGKQMYIRVKIKMEKRIILKQQQCNNEKHYFSLGYMITVNM